MIRHYSIDLGIHPDATGGHAGTAKDPCPLQVAVTKGTLLQEQEDGPYNGFKPEALASFAQIKEGDVIIFRVFETRSLCIPIGGRRLQDVDSVEVLFTELDGRWIPAPWKRNEDVATITQCPDDQISLAFASAPEGTKLPCYFQQDSVNGIVTHTIMKSATGHPVSYLFSVQVKTAVETTTELQTCYYQDDPEMVIGPDEDPWRGDENLSLDQLGGSAATSR